MTTPQEQAQSGPSWHPAVQHTCRMDGVFDVEGAIHVVVRPAHPGETPVTDILDAGYELLTYSVSLDDPPCDAVDRYPQCQHLLLRRRQREGG